jgi:hypothetical protein
VETAIAAGAGNAAAQAATLANTGQGVINRTTSTPARDAAIAGLIAVLVGAYLKRKEIMSRFIR